MDKFKTFSGIVAPLDKNDIDTDAIIPKQYLKSILRTGFGVNLFDEWRYLEYGEPGDDHSIRQKNNDFVLNKKPYDKASVLLTGKNFGCGSSREHAAWAIKDFGIKTILAESFADIFYNNCFKNGILPIVLNKDLIKSFVRKCHEDDEFSLKIDLENQIISGFDKQDVHFDIDPYRKKALLKGLDEIGQTLEDKDLISDFEQKHKKAFPWLF